MKRHDRLFVIWSEPDPRGTRHVIGELAREQDGHFTFGYRLDQLADAEQAGFRLLAEFPTRRAHHEPYRAGYLFSTFAQRIPSPKRPDFKKMMDTWKVAHPDDQMEILASSGGILLTDHIELAEYRDEKDDLREPLEFRVAGERHGDRPEVEIGERVDLIREAGNRYDRNATCVLVCSGKKLGYVPRQYSAIFSRILDEGGRIDGTAIRRLLLPPERDRWIIRARAL